LVQVSSAAIVSKTARSGKQKPYWVPEKTLSSYLAAALSSAYFSSPGMWDETRPKKMREQIEAMKEAWTKDRPVSRRVRQLSADDDLRKPVQKPHPPIIVGGAFRSPRGARSAMATGCCFPRQALSMCTVERSGCARYPAHRIVPVGARLAHRRLAGARRADTTVRPLSPRNPVRIRLQP
jgi:hypothetical protein